MAAGGTIYRQFIDMLFAGIWSGKAACMYRSGGATVQAAGKYGNAGWHVSLYRTELFGPALVHVSRK